MMRIYLLQVCVVRSEVSECVKTQIHTGGNTGPQGNCTRKQEAWRAEEKVCEKPLTVYEQQRDCTESRIACELMLRVIRTYFHLYDNTEIGVFN